MKKIINGREFRIHFRHSAEGQDISELFPAGLPSMTDKCRARIAGCTIATIAAGEPGTDSRTFSTLAEGASFRNRLDKKNRDLARRLALQKAIGTAKEGRFDFTTRKALWDLYLNRARQNSSNTSASGSNEQAFEAGVDTAMAIIYEGINAVMVDGMTKEALMSGIFTHMTNNALARLAEEDALWSASSR